MNAYKQNPIRSTQNRIMAALKLLEFDNSNKNHQEQFSFYHNMHMPEA